MIKIPWVMGRRERHLTFSDTSLSIWVIRMEMKMS